MRALHRDRPQAADAPWYGLSRNQSSSSVDDDHDRHAAHHRRLDDRRARPVGEEEHEDEDDRGAEEQDDPERHRDHALGAVRPVGARVLAVGALVEPLGVRRLLGGRARLDRPQRAERGDAPRVDRVAEGADSISRPLLVDDRPRVADELARQRRARRRPA